MELRIRSASTFATSRRARLVAILHFGEQVQASLRFDVKVMPQWVQVIVFMV